MTIQIQRLVDVVTWAVYDHEFSEGLLDTPVSQFDGWGTWNQGSWAVKKNDGTGDEPTSKNVCGSAFCIAGQAAVQSGAALILDGYGGAETAVPLKDLIQYGVDPKVLFIEEDDLPVLLVENLPYSSISEVANEWLGIRWEGDLYGGDNSIENVVAIAVAVAWTQDGVVLPFSDHVLNYLQDEELGYALDSFDAPQDAFNDVKDAYGLLLPV